MRSNWTKPGRGEWCFIREERNPLNAGLSWVMGHGRTATFQRIIKLLQERMVEKLEEKQRRREYEPGFEESEAARQLARIAPYLEYRGQRVISPLGLLQGELKVMNLTERAKHSIDFAVMKRSRSLPDLRTQSYT